MHYMNQRIKLKIFVVLAVGNGDAFLTASKSIYVKEDLSVGDGRNNPPAKNMLYFIDAGHFCSCQFCKPVHSGSKPCDPELKVSDFD